jgi:hypothetical protein
VKRFIKKSEENWQTINLGSTIAWSESVKIYHKNQKLIEKTKELCFPRIFGPTKINLFFFFVEF